MVSVDKVNVDIVNVDMVTVTLYTSNIISSIGVHPMGTKNPSSAKTNITCTLVVAIWKVSFRYYNF